jgi:hypothetical protein
MMWLDSSVPAKIEYHLGKKNPSQFHRLKKGVIRLPSAKETRISGEVPKESKPNTGSSSHKVFSVT